MHVIPVIDIRGGQCVCLRQGQFHDAEVYSHTPANIARMWESENASCIHIVDLDGALAGHSVNDELIKNIIDSVTIPVQVGGGIRTINDIETKLSLGVSKVIIGTQAVDNPDFVKYAIDNFGPDKIIVSIDARDGMAAIKAWEKTSSINAVNLGIKMLHIGVENIIYSDISKDGMLKGPNIERTEEIIKSTGINIIAAGGISSLNDLERLNDIGAYGTMIGKALYENRVSLKEAIELYEKGERYGL